MLFRELNRTTNRVFGPPRWKATPELVRQDRGRVFGPSGSWIKVANTDKSFARRSGAWQQCRAPFLFGLEAPVGRHFPEVIPLGNGTPTLASLDLAPLNREPVTRITRENRELLPLLEAIEKAA